MASTGVHESVHSVTSPNDPESDAQALISNEEDDELGVPTEFEGTFSDSHTQPTKGKKRKTMPLRSSVWKHFDRLTDKNGNMRVICKHCKKSFPYSSKSSGTSSLKKHAEACELKNSNSTTQSELVIGAGGALGSWKFDESVLRKAIAYYLVIDELPLKHVEKAGFRRLMSACCPRFRIPSRFTIARDIIEIYEGERVALRAILRNSSQRICITTDTWTSVQNINYMSITAHYIDNDWSLHKKILNFCPITSHKGEDIGKAIESCLRVWGLEHVFTVTVDNASANDLAIEYLKRKVKNRGNAVVDSKHMHMRCVAHILNLVVADGIKQQEAQQAVKRIRFAVRYVKKSPQRLHKFKKYIEQARIQSKALLCLDVPTRWNSTYLMLEAAEKFEKAFEIYSEEDSLFKLEMESECGLLDENDWTIARNLIAFLKKFYLLTLKVSGSSYVTSNIFFPEIVQVAGWLKLWCAKNDPLIKSMAVKMKDKYDKYWGNIDKMNMLIYIACILDPRRKFKYIEYVLHETFSSTPDKATTICKQVKDSLIELFEWYAKKLKIVESCGPNTSSSCNIGNETQEMEMEMVYEMDEEFYSLIETDDDLSDLDRYLKEKPMKGELDILKWWKQNTISYPILSEMARDVLAVPISTVASESAFSTGGRVLNDFRSSLSPRMVETLICSQDWFKSSFVGDEEDEESVQEMEKEFAKFNIGKNVSGSQPSDVELDCQ